MKNYFRISNDGKIHNLSFVMKKLFLFFSLFFAITHVSAQKLDWLVSPQYSNIIYYGPQMYRLSKDGKVGLVGSDGKIIVPVEYDGMSLFYEGRAIFVNKTLNGWKFIGVVTDDGRVNYSSGNYYLINDEYTFYSEGFIPVRDSNGKFGFLNDKCRPAFEFTDDEIRPFSEGFAAIGTGDNFHWINTSGEEIWLRLINGGTPYGGTNYYRGKAYVWDGEGEIFELSADGRQKKLPDNYSLVVDYLYRAGSGKGYKVEYSQFEQTFSNQWQPESHDGKWTYMSREGEPLSPFQYDEVKKFSNGTAIASVNGKYGLLHILPDNSKFSTQNVKGDYTFSAGSICICEFRLSVPEKWRDQHINVLLTDVETGHQLAIQNKGNNNYSFSYKPSLSNAKETKDFKVEVKNNEIRLWQGQESFTFVKRQLLSSSIRVNNADANSDDKCVVTATIKNPSSIDVTTTVTLSGGGDIAHFQNKTETITIPAYSSRSITSSFLVRKVELNGWCSVSTSDGGKVEKCINLELKPF